MNIFSKEKKIKEIEDKIEELKSKICELRKDEECDECISVQEIRNILEQHCSHPISQSCSIKSVKEGCKIGCGMRYTVDMTPGSWIPEIQKLDKSLKCAGFKLQYISQSYFTDCGVSVPVLYLLIDTKDIRDETKSVR